MSQEKPKTYTAEFRESAVKLANESDQPITQTTKDLGINVNTLHTWIGKYSPSRSSKPWWKAMAGCVSVRPIRPCCCLPIPDHTRDMAAFMLATGLREANVCFLEWSQINMQNKLMWVHADESKTIK
ncbi:MAG: tyrosine-type recombinase/integrase [Methylococcales bacterium]|nr:tyrosine-type recombinase/integrase [Methylococcales bacterium]